MELAQTEFRFQMGRFGYLRPLPIDPLAFRCGHALLEVVDFLAILHQAALEKLFVEVIGVLSAEGFVKLNRVIVGECLLHRGGEEDADSGFGGQSANRQAVSSGLAGPPFLGGGLGLAFHEEGVTVLDDPLDRLALFQFQGFGQRGRADQVELAGLILTTAEMWRNLRRKQTLTLG
jgi:hypothetical protein